MKKILSLVIAICLIVSLLPATAFAAVIGREEQMKNGSAVTELARERRESIVTGETAAAVEIENPGVDLKQAAKTELLETIDAEELVRVIVVLEDQGLLEQGFTTAQIAGNSAEINARADALVREQETVLSRIQSVAGKHVDVRYHYTVALNGMAVEIPYGKLEQIKSLKGVKDAFLAPTYELPQNMAADTAQPNMYATKESFGSAQTWKNLGYTGQGMTIAIIDTGLDVDHPSFAAAPEGASMTLADVQDVLTELNAYRRYSLTSAMPLTAEKLYYSEKVPYGFNYVDNSLDVTHDYDVQGDHGTHVAGISAANAMDSTDVVGVAPDAQLLVMKVFGQNGGAYADDIMAALEDCIRMDVDVVNLSLGAPAGFTSDSAAIDAVYSRILACDMVVAMAGGNSYSAAYMNGTVGTNLNKTADPDNGVVSSPSTYIGATMVASMENGLLKMNYFTVGDLEIPYADATTINRFTKLAGRELTYVMVPGWGQDFDYAGLDVAGKVAVVSRGGGQDVTFVLKQQNAFDHGAIACIVYDNVVGSMINMYDGGLLPNVFISNADGLAMKEAAGEDGIGTMMIMPVSDMSEFPSYVGGQMSDFSSWGVTPDLQLAPDVTAPGGNIYSSVMDGKYDTMSGTSMASPHIAGMSALVLQALREKYPHMDDATMHTAAESLIMATAVPLTDPNGILYSPRKQGAGSANVYSAVTSPVFLTSQQPTGELTPKASMGDDDARTGAFAFSFQIHNLENRALTYVLDAQTLTDQFTVIDGVEYMGETGRELSADVDFYVNLDQVVSLDYDLNADGITDLADVQLLLDMINGLETLPVELTVRLDLNDDGAVDTADAQKLYELVLEGIAPEQAIEIPAMGEATVYVTVQLSEEDMAYMDAHYENGIYVDGFVRLYAQDVGCVDLSLPFMGFYGDWSAARVFDDGWYWQNDEDFAYDRYYNVIFTTFGPDASSGGGLGINPYIVEEYDPEHNVLSPNGDLYYDYVNEIYTGMMRGAELLDYTWTDANGEQLFYDWYAYARKSFYMPGNGVCLPAIYTNACVPYTFTDSRGNLTVAEGDHLTLTIRGYLDDGELDSVAVGPNGEPIPNTAWADDVIEIPVVIDNTAPRMDISSIRYFTENGRSYVSFDVSDNYDIAAVVPMTAGNDAFEYVPVTTKVRGVDGEQDTITLDITDYDASFTVALCDYGCNESFYQLTNPGTSGLSSDRFYSFLRYCYPTMDGYVYMTDQLNGWYSFESSDDLMMHTSQPTSGEQTVYAAEYVDGYIIGAQGASNDVANTLFIMKAGTWDRTQLGNSRAMNFTVYEWPGMEGSYFPLQLIALDMAFDYTTDTMYLLANGLANNYFEEGVDDILLKVDIQTGKVELLGIIEPAGDEPFMALTLACDNDGVLYCINYENGKLYTIDKTPEAVEGGKIYTASSVHQGSVSYYPASRTQSMTVDHATNKLYWAGYQSSMGTSFFFEMDKSNGSFVKMTQTADNAELVGLFKPWDSGRDIIPEVEAYGMSLTPADLFLNIGQNATLMPTAEPFNGKLGQVTWSSSDESVATVNAYGMVLATGIGAAEITAECGDLTATATVNVTNVSGTLFAASGEYWYMMDSGKPFEANLIADAAYLGDIKAAAYVGGSIYAATVEEGYDEDYNTVYTTTLHKLDTTLQGGAMATIDGNVTALAFNYADGFLYGLTKSEVLDEEWNYSLVFELIRVNPATGETVVVTDLNELYTFSDLEWRYDTCSGALAIDYEGNFYVNGSYEDMDTWDQINDLKRFRLDENDQITDVVSASGLGECGYSGDAMVWSERNGGLLRVAGKSLSWIDVSDMENAVEVGLGSIRSSGSNVFALVIPLSAEPQLPQVNATEILLEESYLVYAEETTRVVPTVEPWNANCTLNYAVADESIATVDRNGVITGIAVGETVLTVTVPGTDVSASARVVVQKNPGVLYGFAQAAVFMNQPLDMWMRYPLGNVANGVPMSDMFYEFTIFAGAYYDGYVYAYGQSDVDSMYYALQIDPASFTYKTLGPGYQTMRDMGFDYTTGTMYAIGYDDTVKGGLYQMDLTTGEMILVGDNDLGEQLTAMAVTPDGTIYAAGESGTVYTVDKDTVELTDTGITGGTSQYLQSMTYDFNNDRIYWIVNGMLYSLDTGNAALEYVGDTAYYTSALFSVPQSAVPELPETVAPAGVRLPELETVAVAETLALRAVVLPVSQTSVDQSLTWTSSDEAIAVVDENGTVTGISAGVVTITATDASGNADSCTVTVTEEHRFFYGYEELSASWLRFDETGAVLERWADAEDASGITAAAYVDGILYAYDAEGCFYTIDTDTFQRTKLGDGIKGQVVTLEMHEVWGERGFAENVPYQVLDMSYDEDGTIYALLMAFHVSKYQDDWSYQVVEVNPADGSIARVICKDVVGSDGSDLRPSNLLYHNGSLYFIDGFISGMLTKVDVVTGALSWEAIFADYWGDFNGGRSFLKDDLTGTIYSIKDKRTEYRGMEGYNPAIAQSLVVQVTMGVARADTLFEIGSGLRVFGMFIK